MKELCKPGPGKCWSGEQGKEKGKPMVSLKFSLKKKKKEEEVVPEAQPKQLHMNVRDLWNNPGDVKPALMANNKSYTLSQMAQAKESEKSNAAAREVMDAKKQKKALKLNKSKLTSGY